MSLATGSIAFYFKRLLVFSGQYGYFEEGQQTVLAFAMPTGVDIDSGDIEAFRTSVLFGRAGLHIELHHLEEGSIREHSILQLLKLLITQLFGNIIRALSIDGVKVQIMQ